MGAVLFYKITLFFRKKVLYHSVSTTCSGFFITASGSIFSALIMRNSLKRLFVVLLFSVLQVHVYAQRDPSLAHYYAHMLLYNPAYAGSKTNIDVSTAFRKQWAGFKSDYGVPEHT